MRSSRAVGPSLRMLIPTLLSGQRRVLRTGEDRGRPGRRLAAVATLLALAAAVAAGFERRVLFELTPAGYVRSVEMFAAGTGDVEIDPRMPSPEIPYVLPGPVDQWAGGMSHALRFRLGLRRTPRLVLHLHAVETHDAVPPLLVVSVEGVKVGRIQTRAGTGLAPSHEGRGVRSHYKVKIPAVTRERGEGILLSITNESGSWVMWERIRLLEADRTWAWPHLRGPGPLPPLSAGCLAGALVILALWSLSAGEPRQRIRVALGTAVPVSAGLLLGLGHTFPEAAPLLSWPRGLWLALPWLSLAASGRVPDGVARTITKLVVDPHARAEGVMARPRPAPPLNVTRLLRSVPLWVGLALFLPGDLFWQFDRAVLGADIDPVFSLWVLAWVYHALTTNPLGLFEANILYPARDTLALSDHRIADQLFFAPAYVLTGSPIVGVNVVMAIQFVLTALGTVLLAHRLFGTWRGAMLAGLFFAFSPTRLAHVHWGHAPLLSSCWTPLALYFLDRFLESRTWRDCWGFSCCVGLQFLASYYLGYFLLVATAVWIAVRALAQPRRVLRLRVLGKGAVGLALAAAAVVPLTLPYIRVRDHYGTLQPSPEFLLDVLKSTSAEGAVNYLTTYPSSLLYGRLLALSPSSKWLFPGFLCLSLAGLALATSLRSRDDRRGGIWAAWALAGIAFVVSMGPEVRLFDWALPAPYAWLSWLIPGFASIRVPARFAIVVAFGLSLAAAAGFRWLEERLAPARPAVRFAVFAVAFGFAIAESAVSPARAQSLPTPGQIPEEYRWLAQHGTGALLELPQQASGGLDLIREARHMYFSVYHWRPLVNGYSGYLPPPTLEVLQRVWALPSTESLLYLQAIGVRNILVHVDTPLRSELEAAAPSVRAAVTRFPSGSLLLSLPEAPRQETISVRVATPTRLPSAADARLRIRFANAGPHYWVNPTRWACRVAITWKSPTGEARGGAHGLVLPPVALAPGEAGEREMPIRVPRGAGPMRLASTVACERGAASPLQWSEEAEVRLVTDVRP